jgi:putative transposase
LSLPKTSSGLELLKVREIISHSARSSDSSLFRWFASHLWSSSLFAYPEPDRLPNIARGGESRAASATGRLQPGNSPAELYRRDRFFWVILSRLWKNWRQVLIIVKPETVTKEIRELIKRMSLENPLWGTPRLQSELRLLGFDLAEFTVAKYRVRGGASPSLTWKTFLTNHAKQIAAIDFFTVPPLTFRNLYCFIILLHDRRQVVHFNVTVHPTAEWTARQLIEAFPEDSAPRYLLRDRDQIYGAEFRLRVQGMQIEEVITAPRSSFQNPYAERVIGSIRRECLDHLIIIGEDHLRRSLRDYFDYYHNSRPHDALERNSPTPREIEAPAKGKVIAIPQVGGLHHR